MDTNWYNFNHKKINKQFNGDLTYVSTFCVNKEYAPSAVYKAAHPDRDQGHKDYLLLSHHDGVLLIRGMDHEDIEKHKCHTAIVCKKCKDTIYSVMRHDYRECGCKLVAVDGGHDYFAVTGYPEEYELGYINLLTGEFTLDASRI